MASALDMLGDLMQAGMTRSGAGRIRTALDGRSPGGLGGVLEQMVQQAGGGASSGSDDLLGGLTRMAQEAWSDPKDAVKGGNPLAVGGLGALVGAVLGNPGGAVKGALGAGAMALLATLAKSALSGTGSDAERMPLTDLPLGLRDPADASEERDLEDRANLILAAMINAAKADGAIDQQELARIVGRLEESDAEARAFVMDELGKPIDLEGLVRAVPDREAAVQVYAASLLATEADTDAERAYLRRLAAGLGLEQPVVESVHRAFGAG